MVKQHNRRSEAGFTLVELAIVMIIIGLLIGGILKGQELIANAQVTSTVAQAKGIDAAVSTFRDAYNAFPGDMLTPTSRIPNCGAGTICAQAGDANGRLTNSFAAAEATTNEGVTFWAQLAAADVLTGVNPQTASGGAASAGGTNPEANVGGAWRAGFSATGALTGITATASARAGTYILLQNDLTQAPSNALTYGLTPNQAERIDNKIDDGLPNTGSAVALGGIGATNCADVATNAGVYNGANTGILCGLYIRIQS